MEELNLKTEATQVTGCKKCNKKSNTTQKIVFVMGGLMFGLYYQEI